MTSRRQSTGFTLIEVLMVALIIAFLAAVSVPYMVKSIRGNRLRTGARSVIQMARYARTKAILTQQTYLLHINSGTGSIAVGPAEESAGEAERELDGVRIDYIAIGGDSTSGDDGGHTIRFERNGLCGPFEVRLTDDSHATITIVADAVGSMQVDREAGL